MTRAERFTIDPVERAAQAGAADPAGSVWVSAHAGSGKTYVLTRRVVRLLLEGAPPSKILCLTYTKAAAANMQNRVFAILAGWVALDDRALGAAIEALDGARPSPERIARARRLFAETVETPGGLRIQTIHAFCERLLHLFPLEANVPAHFEVLDDADRTVLLGDAVDGALREALAKPEAPLGLALSRVTEEADLPALQGLIVEAIRAGSGGDTGLQTDAALRTRLDLRPGETAAGLEREIVEGRPDAAAFSAAVTRLLGSSPRDRKLGETFRAASAWPEMADQAQALTAAFLNSEGEPHEKLVTNPFRKAAPDLAEALEREQGRVLALAERRKAAAAAERTIALLRIADAVRDRLVRAKQQRGLLDFDDLVRRTQALLTRASSAWVLYKLDGGVDHLLIDEAQDTGPEHWAILKALTDDFFAGATRAEATRTIFAVGDEKQSIYSFQGVDPAQFALARDHYRQRLDGTGPFADVSLRLSFRSTSDVLGAVDRVFAAPANRKGLTHRDDEAPVHASARFEAPGLVEIWPSLIPVAPPTPHPNDPVDAPAADAPAVLLAQRIAGTIRHWLRTGARFENDAKLIRPGDIKILVQKRSTFFEAMIRALKENDVAVAGADRLVLTDHIAVMDLIALGRVVLLPQDDLTLATVLLSPLCGLTDDDLIDLAPGRARSLWSALVASEDPRHARVARTLERWRTHAEGCTPFSFYAAILGRERMREAMLARLGQDAADPLDAFLSDALAHSRRHTPSLAGFLADIERQGREVKRDPQAQGDAVEVMTVHAAKGLEARIVFLADTFTHPLSHMDSPLITLPVAGDASPVLVWSPRRADDPPVVGEGRAAREQNRWAEYRRLLYVGMTRARDRLYLAGSRGSRAVSKPVWYTMLEAALQPDAEEHPAEWGDGVVWRWRSGKPSQPAAQYGFSVEQGSPPLPAWITSPAPPESAPEPPIRPSRLFGASERAAPPGLFVAETAQRRRGVILHRLFELLPDLPPEQRRSAGEGLLAMRDIGPEGAAWLETVLAALNDPGGSFVFGPDGRSEVSLAGSIESPEGIVEVSARVDRLRVTDEAVFLTDLKTGRPPADPETIPDDVARQLAIYAALLRGVYPDRPVRAFVLWTALPLLVEARPADLERALARTASVSLTRPY